MKVGFNMLLWGPAIATAHRPLFADLKRSGYDGVEIPLIVGGMEEYKTLAPCLTISARRFAGGAPSGLGSLERGRWIARPLGSKLLVGPIHQTRVPSRRGRSRRRERNLHRDRSHESLRSLFSQHDGSNRRLSRHGLSCRGDGHVRLFPSEYRGARSDGRNRSVLPASRSCAYF